MLWPKTLCSTSRSGRCDTGAEWHNFAPIPPRTVQHSLLLHNCGCQHRAARELYLSQLQVKLNSRTYHCASAVGLNAAASCHVSGAVPSAPHAARCSAAGQCSREVPQAAADALGTVSKLRVNWAGTADESEWQRTIIDEDAVEDGGIGRHSGPLWHIRQVCAPQHPRAW